MSRQGGQNLWKHGSPHTNTHEFVYTTVKGELGAVQVSKPDLTNTQTIFQHDAVKQHGGLVLKTEGKEMLSASAVLGAGDATPRLSAGTVIVKSEFQQPTAVTLHPQDANIASTKFGDVFLTAAGVEWLKDRKLEVAQDARDIGDIFDTGAMVTDADEGDVVTFTAGQSVFSTCTASTLQSTQSSPSSPLSLVDGRSLSRQRSLSETDRSMLSAQDRACLEEIERGSQLTPEEREMFENSRRELQAMDFQVDTEKNTSSILLMPQGMEATISDPTIEFEETGTNPKALETLLGDRSIITTESSTPASEAVVVTKDELLISAAGSHSLPVGTIPGSVTLASPTAVGTLQSSLIVTTAASAVAPQTSAVVSSVQSVLSSGTVTSSAPQAATIQPSQVTSQPVQGNPNLSAISITVDKGATTTKILVSSDKGEQVMHLNTSDLMKVVQETTTNSSGTKQDGSYIVIPCDMGALSGKPVATGNEAPSAESGPIKLEKTWLCPYQGCGKSFCKPSKLKVHIMIHTKEKPFKCKEPGCDWGFTTKTKLDRHMETHTGKKDFMCIYPGCGRQFTTVYNLKAHVKLHDRPNTHECPVEGCEEKFDLRKKLDQHLRHLHKDVQKSYKCPHEGCNKTFYSAATMGSHTRVHAEERDLTCYFDGCGRKFDQLSRFKQHIRTHTGERPYICNVEGCTWAFSSASKLRRHQLKHTGERKFECDYPGCGKAFLRAEHLRVHVRTHCGDRPFECTFEGCGMRFMNKTNLTKHFQRHQSGVMNKDKLCYICPLDGCDKRYMSKASLRSHILNHYQLPAGVFQSDLGVISLLNSEDMQEGLTGLPQDQKPIITAAENADAAGAAALLSQDTSTINTGDLIGGVDQGNLGATNLLDLVVNQQVDSNVVTQLLVANEMNQRVSPVTHQSPSILGPKKTPSRVAAAKSDERSMLKPSGGSGSARTDFHSNMLWKAKAQMRAKQNKERLSLDLPPISEPGELGVTKQEPLAPPTSSFNLGSMLISPQGITYQDPETGVLYQEVQLLQDDPPDCDIYGDDTSSITVSDHGGLSADPTMPVLHDSPSDPNPGATTFTGSTLNLQDLE